MNRLGQQRRRRANKYASLVQEQGPKVHLRFVTLPTFLTPRSQPRSRPSTTRRPNKHSSRRTRTRTFADPHPRGIFSTPTDTSTTLAAGPRAHLGRLIILASDGQACASGDGGRSWEARGRPTDTDVATLGNAPSPTQHKLQYFFKSFLNLKDCAESTWGEPGCWRDYYKCFK